MVLYVVFSNTHTFHFFFYYCCCVLLVKLLVPFCLDNVMFCLSRKLFLFFADCRSLASVCSIIYIICRSVLGCLLAVTADGAFYIRSGERPSSLLNVAREYIICRIPISVPVEDGRFIACGDFRGPSIIKLTVDTRLLAQAKSLSSTNNTSAR